MGKIDDVKKIALFSLILTKLGEIEDKLEAPIDMGFEKIMYQGKEVVKDPNIPITTLTLFECPTCKKVFKSNIGKIGHMRSHNK